MKSLDEIRDELAGTYCNHDINRDRTSFKLGFNAAIEHLSKPVEFDEMAAEKECAKWSDTNPFTFTAPRGVHEEVIAFCNRAINHMARWQFEQDRARIGWAEYNRSHAMANEKIWRDKCAELEAARADAKGLRSIFEEWEQILGGIPANKFRELKFERDRALGMCEALAKALNHYGSKLASTGVVAREALGEYAKFKLKV